jgi:hypothetical protein
MHTDDDSDSDHGEPVSIQHPIGDHQTPEQGHHLNDHHHPVTTIKTTRSLPARSSERRRRSRPTNRITAIITPATRSPNDQ